MKHRHRKAQLSLSLTPPRRESEALSPETKRELVAALSQLLMDAQHALVTTERNQRDER